MGLLGVEATADTGLFITAVGIILLTRDPVTGAIIRPHDEEGNLILKTRTPRNNKENGK